MNRISKYTGLLAMSALGISQFAWSSTPSPKQWLVDIDHGSGNVEFRATGHPSSLKIVGKGSAPHGSFTISKNLVSGSVSFDLTSLDTGIDLRTNHMKEKYLETGKYHDAKLTLTQMVLPQDISADHVSVDQVPFTGNLLLHGVEKPVSGVAKIEKSGGKVSIAANFNLKVSDYKIAVPTFAGITMADDVQVSVADSAPVIAR